MSEFVSVHHGLTNIKLSNIRAMPMDEVIAVEEKLHKSSEHIVIDVALVIMVE